MNEEAGLVGWLSSIHHFHIERNCVLLSQVEEVMAARLMQVQAQICLDVQVTHADVVLTTVLGKGALEIS